MQVDESVLQPDVREKMLQLRELRTRKETLKGELEALQLELERLNQDVTEYFEAHRIQMIHIEGVGKFYLNRTLYPAIEDVEKCHAWLKERGLYEMLLSFNTNKFKGFYKERLENGEELPEGVNQFFKTDVRLRKG